ncbi:energy-coupling factor transporter transmembrane component T family protein [Roseibium suaedae]|uniref:Biotin transport system permease protein n=1 Tax=Roseibium suaedae TaxID=735517 RepID=A0A1M7M6V9_9HYPH|nr:energy-coupling factor transporter transmembrane protein EcfT [Roseibium suaedae]SHM86459.1 biotin transport system permease protein [Roseibium suaedae]
MISLYLPGASWCHRLPARLKLILLAVVSMAVFPVQDFWILSALLALTLLAYSSLGKGGLQQVKALRPMGAMLAIIFLLHAVTGDWREGVVTIERLTALILLANLVTITTRMDDMMEAVMPLFAPLSWLGLSPRKPALAVTLVLRFAPVLLSVYSSLREAYQSRSGKRTSWRLMGPFMLQALAMADNVAEALTARGGAEGFGARDTSVLPVRN